MSEELRKEILSIKEGMLQKADKNSLPILRAYKQSLNDIRDEIAKLYVRYAVDGVLKPAQSIRYSILKEFERILTEQGKRLGMIDIEHTTKILEECFKESYYLTAYTLEKGLPFGISFALIQPEFVKAAVQIPMNGVMYSDRIWKNKTLLVNRLRGHLEKAMIQGVSIDKLARVVRDEFGTSAYESKRLIHTEVARVQSQASDDIYKQSGVVKKVMYDATLDKKTSQRCKSLDGKIFDINSDYPRPPQHPNCRSAIVPTIEGWSFKKKRENIKNENGAKPVIDYSSYDNWAASKGVI